MNVLERCTEIAAFIDAVDDGRGDDLVELAHSREAELPEQMILECLGLGAGILELGAVDFRTAMVHRDTVVDVFPGAVDRQLRGNILGRDILFRRAAIGWGVAGGRACALILELEHEIRLERLLDLHLQLHSGELQQADSLLQLRGHRQMLTQAELERLLHVAK